MQTHMYVFCCLFLLIWSSSAQNSPDCRTAIPVCADQPIMGLADGGGDIDDFDPDVFLSTGCLEKGSVSSSNIENNSSWFVFRAGTDGQVGFDIEALPSPGNTTPTAEWDFAVYGPYDEFSGQNFCTIIGNRSDSLSQPIRCNYEVNNTNFTGIGVNPENGQEGAPFVVGSQNTYDEWLEVQSGEIYYILINNFNTNFNGDPEPYIFTFTGSSVQANANTALDCTLRDEFLGLDIDACDTDPNIVLSALNSPAGTDIITVSWSVDYADDGTNVQQLASGPTELELSVTPPNSGRYFVEIETSFGFVSDDILITYFGTPQLDPTNPVSILDTNLASDPDQNNIEFNVLGNGDYEFAINGGEFQDDPIFLDIPAGLNTVIINDKNACGTTAPLTFLVVAYPKFFTPNSDGVNDEWNIKGVETLINPTTFIFDRYGKLVIQLIGNASWDGNYNGRPMPSTDYWFRFEYEEDAAGLLVAKTRKTHFTLKR